MADIFAKTDIFKEEVYHAIVPEGTLLGDYLPADRSDLRIFVNGNPISSASVNTYFLRAEDIVNVSILPGKDAGRTLFYVLAAAALASWGAGLFYSAEAIAAGGIGVTVTKAAFAVLGTYLAMQIIPPPKIATPDNNPVLGRPAITGSNNRPSLYGPIPKLYGTYRYYPPLGAAWFTEISGNDQYLRMLLCLGYGPLSIGGNIPTLGSPITQDDVLPANTIRIDQTDIFNYSDFEYEIGYYDDITLFTQDIQESVPNLPLDWQGIEDEDAWVTDNVSEIQTSGANADELSVDITFPNGLWTANSEGKTRPASARFSVEYRLTGTSDPWISADNNENVVSLYDTVAVPAADDTASIGPTIVLTPPTGMEVNDYVTVFVNYRGTSETISVSAAGGQTWTSETQVNGTNIRFRMFHCRFNGTWATDPSFTIGSGSLPMTAVMLVWRGVDSGTALDASVTSGSFASSNTNTIPGITTATTNAQMVSVLATADDNTWTLPSGWSMASREQYRNSAGSDNAITMAHKRRKNPGTNSAITFTQIGQGPDAGVYCNFALNASGTWQFNGPVKETIRKSIKWPVPQGTYDIRITRTESYHRDVETVFSDATWTALRTIRHDKNQDGIEDKAWNGTGDAVFLALRIKATDQLNGAIDRINILASSVLPVWNGSSWNNEVTANPAWCAYDALTGVQVQRPVPDTRLDVAAFKDWADWCDDKAITYNWVHDSPETVIQRFRAIASVGYATLSIRDGLYTLVRDTVQTTPVQVITPRNAVNFSSERIFKNLPHALRVKYVDTLFWEQDETLVYRDLYDLDSSTSFEELDTQGITNSDQAWNFGQYFMRAAQLRPEIYHVDMDFENLIATRGDLVRLSYDVIQVGLQSARIKDIYPPYNLNLVYNGTGDTGDNSGWSGWTYSSTEGDESLGSFTATITNQVKTSDTSLAPQIDVTKTYNLGMSVKASVSASSVYLGFQCLDENKDNISFQRCWTNPAKNTTVAVATTIGSNTVTINPAAQAWYITTTPFSYIHFNPPTGTNEVTATNDLYQISNINTSGSLWVLTLSTSLSKVYPVGTLVGNSTSGSTFSYALASNTTIGTSWTSYNNTISGLNSATTPPASTQFRRGTKYILPLFYRTGASDTRQFWIDDVYIEQTPQTLVLDEEIIMDGEADYAIRVRKQDGSQVIYPVENIIGLSKTINLTTPIQNEELNIGDLVVFGEVGKETIEAKITQIEYNPDLGARLSMVDAAPEIFDLGVPPVFDPHITKPVDITKLQPQIPAITNVVSDESVMYRASDGSLISAMVVTFSLSSSNNVPIDKVQLRFRVVGSEGWTYLEEEPSRGLLRATGLEDQTIMEFQIRSVSPYGTFSDWSILQSHQIVGKTSPPSDVSSFSAEIRDFTVYLTWEVIPDIDVAGYEIRLGTDWDTASLVQVVGNSNYYIAGVPGVGTISYLIKAIDVVGNYSTNVKSVTIVIGQPGPVVLTYEVIDNNVLLRWTNPLSSLPILHYQVRRGDVFSTADIIGTKDGLFTVVFENVGGTFRYWVAAVDQAGNVGVETSVSVLVAEPPDYILNVDWTDDWTGATHTNFADNSTGKALDGSTPYTTVLAPVDTTITYEDHFTDNSWASPQAQVTAGMTYFAQPGTTAAQYIQTFDYGGVIGASVVTVSQNVLPVAGTVTVDYTISLSPDNSSWTDYPSTTRVFGSGFRYVKITVDVDYSSPTLDDLALFGPLRVRLDSKLRTDSGTDTVSSASAGKTVSFNLTFVDITSIVVTPNVEVSGDNQQIIPVVDFEDVPNPTSFIVYLFNGSGTRVTGDFYWTARGY